MKFCVKLQQFPSETSEMLKTVFGESTRAMFVSGTNVSEKAGKM